MSDKSSLIDVTVVPCLEDNYAYLVRVRGERDAIIVDPSEAAPVIAAIEREGLHLVGILNTHHHFDHVGGNAGLIEKFGKLPVIAFQGDQGRVPEQTKGVSDQEKFGVGHLDVQALHVPGHTTGAVSYHIGDTVFTGDTLFVSGCGRLFEGSASDMKSSLQDKLGALPEDTRVYCGHEYTVANLRFALEIDPENQAIRAALEAAKAKRDQKQPTVPSTIGQELRTNPFMRTGEAGLKHRFGDGDRVSVLAGIRAAKDGWKAS